jgi:hypothetical protein
VVKIYVLMYENGKMRPVETILGMGKMEGVNLTMVYFKNFCKCHNLPPVQQ